MLTAKDPSRFAYFRKLDLPLRLPPDSSYVQRLLTDLLLHPSLSLETVILDCATSLLDRTSPCGLASVRGILWTIQTLRHLVILRVGEASASLIQSLLSKLESITIGVGADAGGRLDVMSILRPFSDTLQTILIKWTPSLLPPFPRTDAGSCYFPLVRTLGIVVSDYSVLKLLASPAFSRAFPAVSHFQLIPADPPTGLYRLYPHRERQVSRLDQIREGNRALRSQRLDTGTRPAPSLPNLKECSGALNDVYASGLDCSLSTLRLWQHLLVRDLDLLCMVLEDTRPQRLCFSTRVDDVRQVLDLLGALRTHVPTHIDMTISVARSSWLARVLKGPDDMPRVNRSFLESSLRYLPTGLVELNIDVSAVIPLGDRSAVRDVLERFTCWTLKAAPGVALTCRLAADEDWKWPDLGQEDDLEHILRPGP
ncbi:hypothetical protein GSI_05033 [Ganoderma sinense ZZ0214-1]|uniref:F-box domain-containing protein n=1 Tax=Ganoderma sinense ZZ0214-1 TaxID=1077348 RepID=A0A2G8SGK6_9APHY|nr:hypothetical protein GSI_05033 [Ganoderma sinense ZZ0214-1]